MSVESSSHTSYPMESIVFATGSYDHTIKLWQAHTGICIRTLQHAESQVNALEISPNDTFLAAASYQHIKLYDLKSGNITPVYTYEGISKNVTCVCFNESGSLMFSGGEDGKIRVWDMKESHCKLCFELKVPVNCLKLHPNGTELFIGDANGIVHIKDLSNHENRQYIPDSDCMILDLALSPLYASQLSLVNNKGKCYVWNVKEVDGQNDLIPLKKFDAHPRQALKCKFSSDAELLVTTSADHTARIWSTQDFSLLQELKTPAQRWVWDAAFTSDSQYLFTGSSDNVARLYNVKTGIVEKEYTGHSKAITAIAFKD